MLGSATRGAGRTALASEQHHTAPHRTTKDNKRAERENAVYERSGREIGVMGQ